VFVRPPVVAPAKSADFIASACPSILAPRRTSNPTGDGLNFQCRSGAFPFQTDPAGCRFSLRPSIRAQKSYPWNAERRF
jgi:hypothetical protein